ncbi:hypothetical protein [Clostridium manihotivorum]|nr:hypothetical protein [Clostridium manihotivorum]
MDEGQRDGAFVPFKNIFEDRLIELVPYELQITPSHQLNDRINTMTCVIK